MYEMSLRGAMCDCDADIDFGAAVKCARAAHLTTTQKVHIIVRAMFFVSKGGVNVDPVQINPPSGIILNIS